MLRPAHEHPAVAPGRRLRLQLGEPLRQHRLHLGQGDGTDIRHRTQLAEGRQHPVRPAQDHRRQGLQTVEPVSPVRLPRKRVEPLDHGQGEPAQMPEIAQIAFEPPCPRRPGIVAGALVEAQAELPVEPRQPADPPVAAADDGRLDQQPVPMPGGAQRPVDDRSIVGIGHVVGVRVVVVRIEISQVEQRSLHRQSGSRQHLVGLGRRHPPPAAGRGRAARIGLRHLPQGEVLREPARGQVLGRARQQREERPAGRVRGPGAPDEPRLDPGPPQGGLQQPAVDLRSSEHHRHPVQRHAGGGLSLHEPGDLHALARLPRRREERDLVAGGTDVLRLRGRDRLEEPGAHPRQRGVRVRRIVRRRHLRTRQPAERRPRPLVPLRNRREKPRGPTGDGRDEAAGGPVVHRHVQQHYRHVERHVDGVPGRDDLRGQPIEFGDVDEMGLAELPGVLPRQRVEVGPDRAAGRQLAGFDAAETQVFEGRRQGSSEAAQTGDGREIPEGAAPELLEGGAGGDRLGAEPGGGGQPAAGEARGREPGREPAQAEAVETERGAAPGRPLPREVVDGIPGGADDQRLGRRGQALEKTVRGSQPRRRARGSMQRDRSHDRLPPRGPAHAPASTRQAPRTLTPPA